MPRPETDEKHALARRLERKTLRRFLAETGPFVLATGGGLVTEPETFALLQESCTTVWAGSTHAMSELHALLAARRPLYEQAELSVDTSSLPVEIIVPTP